jgi:DNA polymerase III gamma/tau subunit
MWKTSGHQNQKIFLDNALAHKKFAHAYLFAGPDMEKKKNLAIEFAQKILGVTGEEKINPDLIIVDQEKLKIEDIRNLISELSLKPYQYGHKVAVIENFENVTAEGANSILKTLEEPNSSTIIILLAKNKQQLLPTILSRCQILYFNRTPQAGENGELQKIAQQPQAQRILAIKEYAEMETADLSALLQDWLNNEHYQFLQNPKKYINVQSLIESISGLKQNFNKKLILERLFLNLV